MVQLALPAALVLLPQLERARRETRVDRAGTIRRANDSGLAAGAGARVARPPGVHQRDPSATAPTTTTCRCLLIGIQPFRKGDTPNAVLAAVQDSRNDRRVRRLTRG